MTQLGVWRLAQLCDIVGHLVMCRLAQLGDIVAQLVDVPSGSVRGYCGLVRGCGCWLR